MNKDMKKGLAGVFGLVSFIGISVGIIQVNRTHSDRAGAEKALTEEGYKIVSYKGTPGFFPRQPNDYYEDEFNVVSPRGAKQEVIVGKTFQGVSQTFLKQ